LIAAKAPFSGAFGSLKSKRGICPLLRS